jgi:flavin-dependent dehydrogenase
LTGRGGEAGKPPLPEGASTGFDVVVLGGGPAGATAASLLAGWGWAVALVSRAVPPAASLAQSIPPSARKLLSLSGVLPRLEGAALVRNAGNTVWWAEGRERSERFGDGPTGFQVERRRLEAILEAHVRDAGVQVEKGTVRRLDRHAEAPGDVGHAGWSLAWDGGPALRARWVLDATGRAGVLAKPALREPDPRVPTLALVRRWRASPTRAPADHTLVESYRDGWAWSVPLAGDERCVTAMVDPGVTGLGRALPLEALYDAELAKTRHLRNMVEGAEPVGSTWACPASPYSARGFGGPGFLLVGDAASFIDPLSSYGVKKALASGWLAAVVVNTVLADPRLEAAALDFHDRRERAVYRSYRRLSAPFFREAALAYAHPYWERRAAAAEAVGGPVPWSDPSDGLVADVDAEGEGLPAREAVEAAWAELRERDRLEAARGRSVRAVARLALQGDRLSPCEHLATDRCPDGMRWVRGVELPALVRAAPDHDTVPDLYQHMAKGTPGLDLPAFLTALATAFAGGFLERR